MRKCIEPKRESNTRGNRDKSISKRLKKDGRRSTHKNKSTAGGRARERYTHMKNNTSAQIKANGAEREKEKGRASERTSKKETRRNGRPAHTRKRKRERERERGRSRLTIE